MPQLRVLVLQLQILHAETKPWCSQINIYFFKEEEDADCPSVDSFLNLFCQGWLTVLWKWNSLSCVQLFATPWTTQSMEFFRPDMGVGSHSLQGIFPTQSRYQTQVSHIFSGFFTSWASRELCSSEQELGIEVKIHCVFFKVLANNCVYELVSKFY